MKKALLKLFVLTIMTFFIGKTKAQITETYSQQLYQPELHNPAALGLEKGLHLYHNVKNYIDCGCDALFVGANSSLKGNKNISVGGLISYDDIFYNYKRTGIYGQFAYHLVDTENHDFSLGTSIGVLFIDYHYAYYNIHTGVIYRGSGGPSFDGEYGWNYQYSKENVQVNIGSSLGNWGKKTIGEYQFEEGVVLTSSFGVKFLEGNWAVEPLLLLLRSEIGPYTNVHVFDFGGRISFKETISLGAGYGTTILKGIHVDLGITPTLGKGRKNQLKGFLSFEIIEKQFFSVEFGMGYLLGPRLTPRRDKN